MLNPLARHKSNRPNDATASGTSDFEGGTATDTAGYMGKEFVYCYSLCCILK